MANGARCPDIAKVGKSEVVICGDIFLILPEAKLRLGYISSCRSSEMKSPLVFIPGMLLSGAVPLAARPFTATDGRTIEGEIRNADASEVTIKRNSDGRDVRVPFDMLIPAHRQEVTAWRTTKSLNRITVSATKDKETSQTRSNGGSLSLDTKDQTWSWVITVKNGSAYPVSGLTLDWAQVVERTDRNQGAYEGPSKTVARRSQGTVPVPEIPAFGSVKVKTQPIVVQSMKSLSYSSSSSTSGRSVTSITSYKWDESLSGLGVAILNGPNPVTRWKTGTNPGGAQAFGPPAR